MSALHTPVEPHPRTAWLMILPAATVACGLRLWIVCGRLARGASSSEGAPFGYAVGIFTLAFLGLVVFGIVKLIDAVGGDDDEGDEPRP